jgi:hypothetical protein
MIRRNNLCSNESSEVHLGNCNSRFETLSKLCFIESNPFSTQIRCFALIRIVLCLVGIGAIAILLSFIVSVDPNSTASVDDVKRFYNNWGANQVCNAALELLTDVDLIQTQFRCRICSNFMKGRLQTTWLRNAVLNASHYPFANFNVCFA